MKRLFVGMLAAFTWWSQAHAGGGAPPPPPPVVYVDHNGSLMEVVSNGNGGMIIRYAQPRPSLYHWGVGPGTVLFHGGWQGNRIVGTAYVFGCGPIPYPVSGAPDRNGVLVLEGLAPIVAIFPFCGVIGWDWTANSHLVFLPR